MTSGPVGPVRRYLRQMMGLETAGEGTDGQLLERFATQQDESAFTALVERHGPMVPDEVEGDLSRCGSSPFCFAVQVGGWAWLLDLAAGILHAGPFPRGEFSAPPGLSC